MMMNRGDAPPSVQALNLLVEILGLVRAAPVALDVRLGEIMAREEAVAQREEAVEARERRLRRFLEAAL